MEWIELLGFWEFHGARRHLKGYLFLLFFSSWLGMLATKNSSSLVSESWWGSPCHSQRHKAARIERDQADFAGEITSCIN